MTTQTVPLSSLEPSRANPRRRIDRPGIEGLAASIGSDSLLHNLVVRPVKGDGKRYRIVSGERRYREQLVGIARECGNADGAGSIGSYKKSELVACLLRHFGNAHAAADPTPAQMKARDWLPGAMLFPAVDPSAPEPQDEDDAADGDGQDADDRLDEAA